jgi:hypothetical protein
MELLTITVVNFVTTVMVNNSIITTKQKKVYNSDGQQFHQYNKTKESYNSDGQTFFCFVVMMELLTITVVNFVLFCCIGGIVDHHCCKLSFVLL